MEGYILSLHMGLLFLALVNKSGYPSFQPTCRLGCVENLKNAKLIIAESGFHWYIYTEKEKIFFVHFLGGLAWGVAKSKLPLFVIFSEIIAIFDNLLLLMYSIQMIQIAKNY